MKRITLQVDGMSCDHCVKAVEEALKHIGANARVHLSEKTVQATYDEARLNPNALQSAIEDEGYDVLGFEIEEQAEEEPAS